MGDARPSPGGTKRKRSVIACSSCHDRKVRCNLALQGVPCSNCMQDGVRCEIYRRKIGIPGQRPLRQRQSPSHEERSYPLTPSPGSAKDRSNSSIAEGGVIDHQIAQTSTPAHASEPQESSFQQPRQIRERQPSTTSSANDRTLKDVVPYFAGESEGLEFLFDQCSPDRPIKGAHYVTPKRTYRQKRLTSKVRRLEPPLPPLLIQQELVRRFFYHVYPVMPIVDAKAFLEAFDRSSTSISPLLLWSMFFAALNFVDKEFLRSHRLAPRKLLKQQYYQHAKEIYDDQDEDDKIILMIAALLLGSWYVDLEDRDGSWYWIGAAISLCHTVGFHRATNFASMPSCPFTAQSRQQWRRIWWSCFYRETWLAQGFGRPMRVHIDDCDVSIPHPEEVLEELRDLPAHLQDQYLPQDLLSLMDAWNVLLHLSIYLADILTMYYRPRSPLPNPANLRQQETDIQMVRNKIPATSFATPPIVLIHICHLEMYFNAALILLYRPYLLVQPSKLTDRDQVTCRAECISKAKAAASDTTNILNKLMSLNAINRSPSSLVGLLMPAMQVLVYDIKHSSGLGKDYATHQLNLHFLVLSQLRKTYWTADLQHNLFTEVMKTMNGGPTVPQLKETVAAAMPANEKTDREDPVQLSNEHTAPDLFDAEQSLAHASLDDFFGIFNPFMGLPPCDELSTSVDWDLSPPSSLAIQSISDQLNP